MCILRGALCKLADRRSAISTLRQAIVALVALAPIVAIVAGLPFANRLEPRVAGLPFLLAWIAGWVLLTPLFLGAAYLLRRSDDAARARR